MELDINVLI